MRLWGVRVAIIAALVGMNVVDGVVMRLLIRTLKINLETTLVDELLMGVVMGIVICIIHEVFRRRYERKLQAAVDELNHHVRNSLQVIVNQQVLSADGKQPDFEDAMTRMDWALREILPREVNPSKKTD